MQTDGVEEFCKYWTRKEAITKAIGSGIILPLDKLNATKIMISEGKDNYCLE